MGDNAMFEAENKYYEEHQGSEHELIKVGDEENKETLDQVDQVRYNKTMKTCIVEEAVQAELDMLKDIIINTIPVEQIILFGSYAYGTPHKDSDLDLYVVMKDEVPMRNIDASLKIYHAISRKKSMPVDIVVNKSSAFAHRKTNPTLERQIAVEGIVLYG
jgi:predicted nucleotidyltransferase